VSNLRNRILVGDVRERLGEIATESVDCVITSPPYFQLRDYDVPGQIGLEPEIGGWVDELRIALNGLARVLKPTGSLWLNLGDTYSRHAKLGAPAKGLLLAPERLLLALADDGWIVRNKVIWAKTNPLPHCVADRLTGAYDVVYFLTRSPKYHFDLDAIRLPHPSASTGRLGKNPGDVWSLATGSFRGAHFATFPPALIERPLLATCPEQICSTCGTPYKRSVKVTRIEHGQGRIIPRPARVHDHEHRYTVYRELGQLAPACFCSRSSRPGVVLDPFFGAGTVGLVAERHGRDWLGIELNPAYAALAKHRISDERSQRDERRAA
jgi:site-specific DNA-methyltransferase (adenine-specific)